MSDNAKLIILTYEGDIIVCDNNGEFQEYVQESPIRTNPMEDIRLTSIQPFQRGMIVSGSGNKVFCYESTDDPKVAYRQISEPLELRQDSQAA
jgi:hypothetical protein